MWCNSTPSVWTGLSSRTKTGWRAFPANSSGPYYGNTLAEPGTSVKDDSWCLALLKHYHSLMPMAQEAHKPMFHLKVADSAIGSHFQAAQNSGKDFEQLARRIAEGAGIKIPHFPAQLRNNNPCHAPNMQWAKDEHGLDKEFYRLRMNARVEM